MSDIDYHGFVAKKARLSEKTIVTESRLDNIVVGTVINYLNGAPLCDLQPTEVSNLFRSRTSKLIPSRSALPEMTDCCFHGFMTTRTQSRILSTTVRHSFKSVIRST